MLGYLRGKIISIHSDTLQCIVLAHRVGYELNVPRRLIDTLTLGQTSTFWIHTHVREDALILFGFATEPEKQFFRVLLGVSGLGPKTALSLLSEHGERLAQLILNKETDEIATAPGVGKKLAQRLVLELAAKLEKMAWLSQLHKALPEQKTVALSSRHQLKEDLTSALQHLGYPPNSIKYALDQIFEKEEAHSKGFEPLLKQALTTLSGPISPMQERSHHG